MSILPVDADEIARNVAAALAEDIGSGDLTADMLPAQAKLSANVICREFTVLSGQAWFVAVYAAVSPEVEVVFKHEDGTQIAADSVVCTVSGPARAVLSGERAALNFIQTLSGTATTAFHFVQKVHVDAHTQILDTRKTLPGLRQAQKYAVRCGGGTNHRMGLYDAILIKENHIQAAGSIANAVGFAKQHHPDIKVEVEVESIPELREAIAAKSDIVMLDNFSVDMIRDAVAMSFGVVKLEVSGNVTLETIPLLSSLGVDYISSGAITKDVKSIDFSMRFVS